MVDLPADIFAEAAAARRLLGTTQGLNPSAPAPGPAHAAAPVASPLVLPPGVELGSALVTETLGLLAGGRATVRMLVRRAATPQRPCVCRPAPGGAAQAARSDGAGCMAGWAGVLAGQLGRSWHLDGSIHAHCWCSTSMA